MMLDTQQLQKILPHAFPFLLIDRVIEVIPGEKLVAIKNITANEWPYSASFQAQDSRRKTQDASRTTLQEYFPETLLIEAAAQAALVLSRAGNFDENAASQRFFIGKVEAQIHEQVKVGDALQFTLTRSRMFSDKGFSDIHVENSGRAVADVTIFFAKG